MILSLLTALQEKENISRRSVSLTTTEPEDKEILTTSVLQLDHMRNKSQYTKTIKRWCEELGIVGRLLFCQRWIFIILQSSESNIKTYIQRNKHQCVDVDSSGHPCKERLLSTLYHGCQEKLAFSSFEVVSLDLQDLKNYLTQYNLSRVYLNYIFPLINKK
ncbi:RWD domain-containing protein 3-like [Palaemon carinicauda]|uniref:RWD domain-containing protein 3-like n=1 Tax=Palaemon carinicauda TaxID=392227 RepID=UPI0035B5F4B5